MLLKETWIFWGVMIYLSKRSNQRHVSTSKKIRLPLKPIKAALQVSLLAFFLGGEIAENNLILAQWLRSRILFISFRAGCNSPVPSKQEGISTAQLDA